MEKILYQKPKRPIGQKHRPVKPTEFESPEDVKLFMRRFGIRDEE